jgi:hypothetical protein
MVSPGIALPMGNDTERLKPGQFAALGQLDFLDQLSGSYLCSLRLSLLNFWK